MLIRYIMSVSSSGGQRAFREKTRRIARHSISPMQADAAQAAPSEMSVFDAGEAWMDRYLTAGKEVHRMGNARPDIEARRVLGRPPLTLAMVSSPPAKAGVSAAPVMMWSKCAPAADEAAPGTADPSLSTACARPPPAHRAQARKQTPLLQRSARKQPNDLRP